MGRFRIQLLLIDVAWCTRYNLLNHDRYNDSSTEWTLVSLKFTLQKYGTKLIYDQIDSAAADMRYSKFKIAHSVKKMDYVN